MFESFVPEPTHPFNSSVNPSLTGTIGNAEPTAGIISALSG
ncbi:hypothetical protein [Argonema galeatum]|nr:hypothetical protein [Argonema galeatum]